ncbi:hypothetical protein BDAP_001564 [Binucleata daphniae]
MRYDTISTIKNVLQIKINQYWEEHPIRLGRSGNKVQIDETKLCFYVKAHRGRAPRSPVLALTILIRVPHLQKGAQK